MNIVLSPVRAAARVKQSLIIIKRCSDLLPAGGYGL